MAPVLGYWSLRGLCEPIRTMLAYAGVDYEEKSYNFGSPPTFDRNDWLDVKHSLGLTVPNLPYYIDGDLKITESNAILRHIARTHNLYGDTEEEKVRIDTAEGVMNDLTRAMLKVVYNSADFEDGKKSFVSDLATPLQKLVLLLGTHNYAAGSKISFVDFLLLELLDRYLLFAPTCLENFPSLQAFQTRFLELPGVKKRRESANFKTIQTRIFGPMSSIGSGIESYEFK